MINRRLFLTSVSALLSAAWAATTFGKTERRPATALKQPPVDGDWDWWRDLERTPLESSNDPLTNSLCRAACERRKVAIIYHGGTNPGEGRRISPVGVFKVEGYDGTYVAAYCHKRDADRAFRIDRIASVV